MKKKATTFVLIFLMGTFVFLGQDRLQTNQATIEFDAGKSNIEPIKAINKTAKIIIDSKTGEIASLITISNFTFPNKLMQEHFNENYMESDKFPKASFTGKINNFSETDFTTEKEVTITGLFNIHGKTKEQIIVLKIIKTNKSFNIKSNFTLQLKDYKIKIPSIMFYKITEEVQVSLTANIKV